MSDIGSFDKALDDAFDAWAVLVRQAQDLLAQKVEEAFAEHVDVPKHLMSASIKRMYQKMDDFSGSADGAA